MKYTGELSKPIERKRFGLLADEAEHADEAQRIASEMIGKLPALAQAHGVPHGEWLAHVPGFNVANPPGRPEVWSDFERASFKIDVDAEKAKGARSVAEAITRVMKAEKWASVRARVLKGSRDGKIKTAPLEQQYYAAAKFTKEHDGKGWEAIVKDAEKLTQG